jgi:hypothetical protein
MRRLTRSEAIEELHAVLLRMVDRQNSLCRVATWRRIFCRGFDQWGPGELERRFPFLARAAPGLHRRHLELIANDRQLARQDIAAGRLPCDGASAEGCGSPCLGWDGFDERTLARFHREICGEAVEVVPDAT